MSWETNAPVKATAVAAATVLIGVAVSAGIVAAATDGQVQLASADTVPLDPQAQAWDEAPATTVNLSKQQVAPPFGGGSVEKLNVRALTNDTHVGFQLTWEDPTRDANLSGPQDYSDAVAILPHGGEAPPITMGAAGTPVNIWYWRASWQADADRETGQMYAYPHPDNSTQPGTAAGNPLSAENRTTFAHNYYARGFGSLTHAPTQTVEGFGNRTSDGWTVTFVRERAAEGKHDVSFEQADQVSLAFAVWDGSADEVNGEKSITMQFSSMSTEPATPADTPWLGAPPTQVVLLITTVALAAWAVTYWRARDA